MSDVDAPMRYGEPAGDESAQEGSIGLVVLLALGLAIAAVALAMLTREAAEPFVLAILAGLSVVGVFSLFAGAVGILHFGERARAHDVTRALADSLPQGALVTTAGGEIVYTNKAYRRIVGAADGDEDDPVTVERAFSGDTRIAEHIFRLSRAARQGRPWDEEFALSPGETGSDEPEAGARWFRVSVRQIPSRSGTRRGSALTLWQVADITAERRNQETAFETLQHLVEYLDNAPAGFLSADPSGGIEYMNATLAQWLGINLSDVAGGEFKLGDIVLGETDALFASPDGATGPERAQRLDVDMVRRDGTSLPVRVLYSPPGAFDGSAGLSHMIVLSRARGAKELDATAAETRFSAIFHSTPIAIATVDEKGRIGESNAAFVRMFARGGERFVTGETRLADIIQTGEGDALDKALEAARGGQADIEPVDGAFGDHGARSGRFYFSAAPAVEGEHDTVIVYAIDTTEHRALEMQMAQSQKMQAVGQLAGGIAHDFNNVLTAIIGFSELLLASHRPTDPAFQDIMNIKQNANRAAGLVRQLLAFSRQQTLRPEVLSLSDVLADLTILLGRLLGEKIELDVQHGRDLWLVKADLHQFEQVIINLAVNARDAMPDGGKLTIRTANVTERESRQLGHSPMEPGEYVLCEVTDTGAGMTPDVMEKIFEPFFSTKEVGKGTGLGLSTVYGIIKQTGGYIFPQSEGPGQGTTFRIYLPRHVGAGSEGEEETADEALEEPDEPARDLTGSGTILLVEDEEAVRSFAARALTSRGYEVLEAGTGAEAMELMSERPGEIDLVVSDVVMPEMDGPTLLRKLREVQPDIRVIFISGYAEDAFRKNLDDEEKFVFLPKPFSLKQLALAVKETLEEA